MFNWGLLLRFCDDSIAFLLQHCFGFSTFFNGRYNTRKEHVIEELKKDANNFQKEVFFHFDFHRRHPCFRSPGGRRLRDRQVCQVPNLLVGSHREAAHILCSQGFASFSTRSPRPYTGVPKKLPILNWSLNSLLVVQLVQTGQHYMVFFSRNSRRVTILGHLEEYCEFYVYLSSLTFPYAVNVIR